MDFASTQNKLLKHCISAGFLLVAGYLQGALQKELKQLLWESLTDNICQSLEEFTKHCIFVDVLLLVSYIQGTLRKKLLIVIFVERFKTSASEKLH